MTEQIIAYNNIINSYSVRTGDNQSIYGIEKIYKFFLYVASIYNAAKEGQVIALSELLCNPVEMDTSIYFNECKRLLENISATSDLMRDDVNAVLGIKKRGRKKKDA